jgi:hypothetical protein
MVTVQNMLLAVVLLSLVLSSAVVDGATQGAPRGTAGGETVHVVFANHLVRYTVT